MSRLETINPQTAPAAAKILLDEVTATYKSTPNFYRVLASSPTAFAAVNAVDRAVETGTLPPRLHEQLAIAVAAVNDCEYCLAAHTYAGRFAGLDAAELAAAQIGESVNAKAAAALRFAQIVARERGRAADEEVENIKRAGYSDGEILEIILHVALNTLTNYINNVARTKVDFPTAVRASGATN